MTSPPPLSSPPPEPRPEAAHGPCDDQLQALLDGRLPPAEAQHCEQALAHEAGGTARLQALRADREALRGLHAELLDEPVPPVLQAALARAQHQQARWRQGTRWAGLAAALLLSFGAGWSGRGWEQGRHAPPAYADTNPARHFAQQASVAHAVFSPEQRHPVEVDASQQQHLVQWLSKRLARPLKLPDLQAQGYHLVGGRLLPGDSGTRAQFMYQNAEGQRLTLYLGALSAAGKAQAMGAPQRPPAPTELAFSFSQDGPVPSFYWVEDGFGYALQAELPRQALLTLAEAVYRQL